MQTKIENYRKIIDLDERYIPHTIDESDFSIKKTLPFLLHELGLDGSGIDDLSNRQILEKQLVELEPGKKLSKQFFEFLDALLQHELSQKQLIDVRYLPLIKSEQLHPQVKASLWTGDITCLKVDAIVNAANNQMLGCFVPFHRCIDNVIHNAAGVQLRHDCYKIMNLQKELEKTGQAKITRAYNLPSKFIIHTVGPIVSGQLNAKQQQQLSQSYINCLEITKQVKGIKSLAFCSISTGVFGFPFKAAAKIAINAVNQWFIENPNQLEQVVFNVFKASEQKIYENLLSNKNGVNQ